MDSIRAHVTDSVKAAIKSTNSTLAVIPGGSNKYLKPLDISANRAFKVALREEWETWMISSEKSFTKTGRMQRASLTQVCQWILNAWSRVQTSTITNGFQKAGLLHDEEDGVHSSDIENKETLTERRLKLELEAGDPKDLQDGFWTLKAKNQMDCLSYTGGEDPSSTSVAQKSVSEKTRCDSSLCYLTQRFVDLLNRSPNGVLDLNIAAQELNAPKRRVYDVTNVLEGIQLIKKKSKNFVGWMGHDVDSRLELAEEMKALVEEERRLDKMIQNCALVVHSLLENQDIQRFAYLTYDDVQKMPSLQEQTVIVIRAPAETKLEVPHPDESLQVHLSSTQGPIEVFLCSDDPVPMDATDSSVDNVDHLNCSANGNTSTPLVPFSPSSNDNAIRTSGCDSFSAPPSKPTQHSSPVTVAPVSPVHTSLHPPSEDPQSFLNLTPPTALPVGREEYLLSLAEDEGITDLFSSFELDQLPLDKPVL